MMRSVFTNTDNLGFQRCIIKQTRIGECHVSAGVRCRLDSFMSVVGSTRDKIDSVPRHKRLYDDLGTEHRQYVLKLELIIAVRINWNAVIPAFRNITIFKVPLYRGHSWRIDSALRKLKEYPELLEKFMLYHYDYRDAF